MTQLTDKDRDVLSAMMITFFHAAERCLQEIERDYAEEYRRGAEFKRLAKKLGTARAMVEVDGATRRIIRGDERNRLGKILDAGKRLHYEMERLTESAARAHQKDVSDIQAFDALMSDANLLCRMAAYMGNFPDNDAVVKAEAMMQLLGKKKSVSTKIVDLFR